MTPLIKRCGGDCTRKHVLIIHIQTCLLNYCYEENIENSSKIYNEHIENTPKIYNEPIENPPNITNNLREHIQKFQKIWWQHRLGNLDIEFFFFFWCDPHESISCVLEFLQCLHLDNCFIDKIWFLFYCNVDLRFLWILDIVYLWLSCILGHYWVVKVGRKTSLCF